MENFESHQNTPEYLNAQKKWKEKGYLGVTAEDHEVISSTPDEILVKNPEKTLGELMNDLEIREYIIETRKNINENENISRLNSYNNDLKQNLDVTIKYLKSINRMPKDLI